MTLFTSPKKNESASGNQRHPHCNCNVPITLLCPIMKPVAHPPKDLDSLLIIWNSSQAQGSVDTIKTRNKLATLALSSLLAIGVTVIAPSSANAVYKYGYMCTYDVSAVGSTNTKTKPQNCHMTQPRTYFRTATGTRSYVQTSWSLQESTSGHTPTGMSPDGHAGRARNHDIISSWQEI